jgi:hypothetical protein
LNCFYPSEHLSSPLLIVGLGWTVFTLLKHLSSPCWLWVWVAQSLIFCLVICRSLFVFLFLLFWPLYCLSFYLLHFWVLLWYLQTFLTLNS